MAVAVTDAGGALIALLRMDGAPPATADVALSKARSAAAFNLPTSALAAGVVAMPGLVTVPNFLAAGGGVPISRGGICIGAIGTSGGSAEQDEAASKAGQMSAPDYTPSLPNYPLHLTGRPQMTLGKKR